MCSDECYLEYPLESMCEMENNSIKLLEAIGK